MSRTWLVTGAGRGLGRAFAETAVLAGDRVVGTVRSPGTLDDLGRHRPDALHEIVLDVTDADAVKAAVEEAADRFGGLDVVVNNAGTGLVGAIEEVDEQLARAHLDVNLFGALWVSRAAIPHLRRQGGGDIVQISTVGAIGSMATLGLYNAGKWALEGFSEAMAAEVAPFGIRVTIAELGGFATDWAGSSMQFAQPLTEYDGLRQSLFGTSEVPWPRTADDTSSPDADPRSAAHALLEHLDDPDRHLRVLIGADAPGQASSAFRVRRHSYAPETLAWPT